MPPCPPPASAPRCLVHKYHLSQARPCSPPALLLAVRSRERRQSPRHRFSSPARALALFGLVLNNRRIRRRQGRTSYTSQSSQGSLLRAAMVRTSDELACLSNVLRPDLNHLVTGVGASLARVGGSLLEDSAGHIILTGLSVPFDRTMLPSSGCALFTLANCLPIARSASFQGATFASPPTSGSCGTFSWLSLLRW